MKASVSPEVATKQPRFRRFLRHILYSRYPKKPSHVLGFLLAAVGWAFTAVAVSQATGEIYGIAVPDFGMQSAQWVVLIGVFAAIMGWVVSAMVTMRSSIKQHTINTLLQSRLSATYMEHARAVNARYFAPDGNLYCIDADDIQDTAAQLPSISYVLNYLEFVAAGVRHGDLDERLMRMTMRGMVCNFYEISRHLIRKHQSKVATSFEHLEWLYGYWFDPGLQRVTQERPRPIPRDEPPRAAGELRY